MSHWCWKAFALTTVRWCTRMKRHATSRKDARRKSAEWTGFFATTTATAIASARTAKTTKAQPAPPVRRAPGGTLSVTCGASSPFDHREGFDIAGRVPVGELPDVQIQRLVAVVGGHLVRLRGQPDRLGHRRACLLAELAEHAALEVDVEAVEHLDRLPPFILLVVPVDVDDVDRALDRAERALDAALFV